MRILTIVGARPQFIKAAPVSRAIQQRNAGQPIVEEIIVHTGQHYDKNMSDIFFRQLALPHPAYNLQAGSGSQAGQTAAIMKKSEEVMLAEKPDMVVIYGDTNSTLAGALTASKLGIPIAHIEAGLRSFNRCMPEEINRIVADRLSDLLLCPTRQAIQWLKDEGIERGVCLTGDVMYDAALLFSDLAARHSAILNALHLEPKSYYLATIHRAENTDHAGTLSALIDGLGLLSHPVILPAHPRLRVKLQEHAITFLPANIRLIEPVSFLDMIRLEQNALMILTDSGGVQKEAYFYKVPCITLRNETEWIETLEGGWNVLVGADREQILRATQRPLPQNTPGNPFGDGHAAEKIVDCIVNFCQ